MITNISYIFLISLLLIFGGWASGDVGESYGEGFPLDNVSVWMTKML